MITWMHLGWCDDLQIFLFCIFSSVLSRTQKGEALNEFKASCHVFKSCYVNGTMNRAWQQAVPQSKKAGYKEINLSF